MITWTSVWSLFQLFSGVFRSVLNFSCEDLDCLCLSKRYYQYSALLSQLLVWKLLIFFEACLLDVLLSSFRIILSSALKSIFTFFFPTVFKLFQLVVYFHFLIFHTFLLFVNFIIFSSSLKCVLAFFALLLY